MMKNYINKLTETWTIAMFFLFTVAPLSMVGQNANLGIGTDFPSTELQINVNNNGFNIPMLIRNENGTQGGNGVGIGFVSESNGNWIKAGIFHERTGGWGIGSLHFLTTTATNASSITLADSRMTIESGGDVGIGTTSPASLLHISSGTNGDAELILEADTSNDSSTEDDNVFITFIQDGGYIKGFIGLEGIGDNYGIGSVGNALVLGSSEPFYASPIQFVSRDTVRMTIQTDGNVGIAEIAPDNLLTFGTDGGIQFANSETGSVDITNFSNGQEAVLLYDKWFYNDNEAGGDGGGTNAWVDNAGGLATYDERGWGGLVSSSNMDDLNAVFNSVAPPSDMRLKENIEKVKVSDVFPKLDQIQAYTYNMISDSDKKLLYGVIAQEIQKIYPNMVRVFDDEGHLCMNYTQLIPILVEAVKELKAENEALKAQLASEIEMIKAALNSNNITVKNASAE